MKKECKYQLFPSTHNQAENGFNVHVSSPLTYCSMQPKKGHEGRVIAWIGSGGNPMDCCKPCVPQSQHDLSDCMKMVKN